MPEGLDSTSFDFYEGIRILVPGAAALAVVEGLARTFSENDTGLSLGSVASFFTALLLGLLFYFVDAPAKAAVVSPLQPTDVLKDWGGTPKERTGVINAYFVMLDTSLPPSIRARALYMGSMYRIGFELIYLLVTPGIIVGLWAVMSQDAAQFQVANLDPYSALTGGFVLLMWALATRRDSRPGAMGPMSRLDVSVKKFSVSDLSVVVVSVITFGSLAAFASELRAWVFSLPILTITSLWAWRYFKGYARQWSRSDRIEASWFAVHHPLRLLSASVLARRAERKGHFRPPRLPRHPIASCHAVFLLGAAVMLTLASVCIRRPEHAGISDAELRIWYGAMALGVALVCSRGHEKRLRGAYMTQNTWLSINREKVEEQYFEPTT